MQQLDDRFAGERAAVDKEISRLRKSTENNRKFLTGLLESYNSGILTENEYLEMKTGYSQEIAVALERVRQLQERQKTLNCQMESYFCLADRMAAIGEDTELSALLVEQLIERVTVNGPDDVTVKFRFESGFEQLMEALEDE